MAVTALLVRLGAKYAPNAPHPALPQALGKENPCPDCAAMISGPYAAQNDLARLTSANAASIFGADLHRSGCFKAVYLDQR